MIFSCLEYVVLVHINITFFDLVFFKHFSPYKSKFTVKKYII